VAITSPVLLQDGRVGGGGLPITLANLDYSQTPFDPAEGFGAWARRNGGITCKLDQETSYSCTTGTGLDVSTAMVVNHVLYPYGYISTTEAAFANNWVERDKALAADTDGSLHQVLSGEVVLACQGSFGCGSKMVMEDGYRGEGKLADAQNWVGLAREVLRINYKMDVNYYYLGLVAHHFGAETAAIKYLTEAQELLQSSDRRGQCASMAMIVCDMYDVPNNVAQTLANARALQAYSFDQPDATFAADQPSTPQSAPEQQRPTARVFGVHRP